jgi:ubiquinone/menaquinone biosynthesis C-methylase UbiE
MSSDTLISLYDQFAPEYEKTRVPRFRPFVKRLLQLYDTRPSSQVLDAGCGTGLAATMVAPRVGHGGRVLGVDASAAMLEIARHKAHGFGFTQCEFIQGDMTHLDVPAESFDLVICSFALWDEPQVLFSEFYRVLKPHGVCLLQNWDDLGEAEKIHSQTLGAFVVKTPEAPVAAMREMGERFQVQWKDINSPEDYENELKRAGFASASASMFAQTTRFASVDEFIDFERFSVRTRAELDALSPDARKEFEQRVRNALAPLLSPHGLDLQWQAVQVIARK